MNNTNNTNQISFDKDCKEIQMSDEHNIAMNNNETYNNTQNESKIKYKYNNN